MSTEDNKALIRRFVEEGWNQKNLALFDELNAPNFVHHNALLPDVRSREDHKQWFTDTRSAFPDFHLTIEDMIAEGDKVVTRWTFRGTNMGDIVVPMPLPATGKQVTISGITISRLAGNQVVEDWHQADGLGFMQQLGVIPSQG